MPTARNASHHRRRRARSPRALRASITVALAAAVVAVYVGLDGGRRSDAAAPASVAATEAQQRPQAPPGAEPPQSAPAPPRAEEAAALAAADDGGPPERLRVRVLASFPHDPESYTQGLLWDAGAFIESAGGYGESAVRRWRPGQRRPLAEARLADDFFAEGIAAVGERLVQLTWREGLAFYRHRETLEETGRVDYQGEGWGLCYDGERLIMSDGSERLTERDPETFAPLREVVVRVGDEPLDDLNELECAEGWVYANVYGTDEIVRIEPATGRVTAIIDASGLLTERERKGAEVLNGIAYNPESETFYLTGKLWPRLFEVVFEPTRGGAGASTVKSKEGARS